MTDTWKASPIQLALIERMLCSHLFHDEERAGVRDFLASRRNDRRIAKQIIDELIGDLAKRRRLEEELERA